MDCHLPLVEGERRQFLFIQHCSREWWDLSSYAHELCIWLNAWFRRVHWSFGTETSFPLLRGSVQPCIDGGRYNIYRCFVLLPEPVVWKLPWERTLLTSGDAFWPLYLSGDQIDISIGPCDIATKKEKFAFWYSCSMGINWDSRIMAEAEQCYMCGGVSPAFVCYTCVSLHQCHVGSDAAIVEQLEVS